MTHPFRQSAAGGRPLRRGPDPPPPDRHRTLGGEPPAGPALPPGRPPRLRPAGRLLPDFLRPPGDPPRAVHHGPPRVPRPGGRGRRRHPRRLALRAGAGGDRPGEGRLRREAHHARLARGPGARRGGREGVPDPPGRLHLPAQCRRPLGAERDPGGPAGAGEDGASPVHGVQAAPERLGRPPRGRHPLHRPHRLPAGADAPARDRRAARLPGAGDGRRGLGGARVRGRRAAGLVVHRGVRLPRAGEGPRAGGDRKRGHRPMRPGRVPREGADLPEPPF